MCVRLINLEIREYLMATRSAEYTLEGFYYQFDKTIFEILNNDDVNKPITIEGIEDIDISSTNEDTAMQIKYQSQTKGTESKLRKPIFLMLKHFNEKQSLNLSYILYGHYKNNDEINTVFDLDRLKSMMIYKEKNKEKDTKKMIEKNHLEEEKISDEIVLKFIKKFTLKLSESFDIHQKNTFEKIKDEMNISTDEEIQMYYSNALKIVYDLSIKRSISSRKINKQDFKKKIDTKCILFNHWFIQMKSKDIYLKYINTQFFKSKFNTLSIERIFIINMLSTDVEQLIEIVYLIEKKYYKKTRREVTKAPYIFIKNISQNKLTELKETLYNDEKIFHDGFIFHGAKFKCKEIIKDATLNNDISIKIVNKKEYLDEILSEIKCSKRIYEFYDNKSISEDSNYVNKIQIEGLSDISKIIEGK